MWYCVHVVHVVLCTCGTMYVYCVVVVSWHAYSLCCTPCRTCILLCCMLGVGTCIVCTSGIYIIVVLYIGCMRMHFVVSCVVCRCMSCDVHCVCIHVVLCRTSDVGVCIVLCFTLDVDTCIAWCCMLCVVVWVWCTLCVCEHGWGEDTRCLLSVATNLECVRNKDKGGSQGLIKG